MTGIRERGEDIRRYIVDNIEKHPSNISKIVADHFSVTRQAINRHLKRLVEEGLVTETGKTKARSYALAPLARWSQRYEIKPGLTEGTIWTNDIRAALGQLPDNAMNIWHQGFTEMFNNAIDHSAGTEIIVDIRKTAADAKMFISDNGVGIFKKIQGALGLLDERFAVLELAKGKLTTDPKNHSGEGIFFTSRIFDSFDILSGGVYFSHQFGKPEDWIVERDKDGTGTTVFMDLHNHTARTAKKVFDQFTSGDEYSFNKTVVPVRLAKYGDDNLISRSQAKRLLARVDKFKTVVFDFAGVDAIGQSFADEIFRVFSNDHPHVELLFVNGSKEVKQMISRARSADPSTLSLGGPCSEQS